MYKYSKSVKETFFKDKFLAFYWLVFRKEVSSETLINDPTPTDEAEDDAKKLAKIKEPAKELKPSEKIELTLIIEEFDTLALETVQKEAPQFQIYIDTGITPGEGTGHDEQSEYAFTTPEPGVSSNVNGVDFENTPG